MKWIIAITAAAVGFLGFKKLREAGNRYYVKKDYRATGTKWLIIDVMTNRIVSEKDNKNAAWSYAKMLNADLTPLYDW